MGKKRRKNQPRLIPEQDKRICGSICLCQLTIVLSCVSIVYLSVAIYMPTYKAFQSGFETEPVMCQTFHTFYDKNYCPWVSCGEWCLTKTSGFCPQMYATTRRNGTEMMFENCTRFTRTTCPEVKQEIYKSKYNCNNGTQCSALTGLFDCSLGHCRNVSTHFLCHYNADGITIEADRDNMKLNGFFDCKKSRCVKLNKPPTRCDRYCPKVTTTAVNVIIMIDDSLITAECDNGYAYNEARGKEQGIRLAERKQIWNETDGILLTNCFNADIDRDGDKIRATDCLNGTLLKDTIIPKPFMNFTQFWKIYNDSKTYVDPTDKFLPKQSSLTIYNSSQLFVNLEGCVNTLRDECMDFLHTHGRDGLNNTAQSRYLCYYNKDDPTKVLARFDLNRTWQHFLIFFGVPSVLFVVSFVSLCIITRSVKVGDDAKMRCKYCTDENSDIDDIDEIANKCVQRLNAIEEAVNEQENAEQPSTSKSFYQQSQPAYNEPKATTSRAAYEEQDTSGAIAPPINLSPCTETTEKSSTSTNIELKQAEDKPLVIL
ncbi:uncharacterized protein LOC116342590 [Contarinia nasturtii]|uniref:uncharacterized protein LOC116342590 n=1 Tax=Contarinia nasturtii TaxID=265458 RepID=UPI0012D44E7E|nr:uncharacterized protein LOC116342590 [Contarinia nasturtii]XP_031626126.1 uncharacterized protein LOC116342590 [Contarinia nasturtii]XP_031626127.1 uncharacterized protein LOC116342590 [Contarinia nasturtii]